LRGLLSEDEAARADRFHFAHDRNHFIVARGMLRVILGRYLRRPPAGLRFDYNAYGKPELRAAADGSRLRFNLSHAAGVALYCVADGRRVGVDVEYVREGAAYEEIAGHFFSERERASLAALPPEARARAFFNCWTRKEAYIKARGEGLSIPLDSFDVSLSPGEPVALLCTRDDALEASRWSLRELALGPDYVAAVAAEGAGWRLCCWRFPA
jgi:4'-phosphopantetheinyl transferase